MKCTLHVKRVFPFTDGDSVLSGQYISLLLVIELTLKEPSVVFFCLTDTLCYLNPAAECGTSVGLESPFMLHIMAARKIALNY